MLSLKKISPTRLIKNKFFEQVDAAEQAGASKEELQEILGRGKAQQGIFLGDIENGELEIGQVCSLFREIPTAKEIVDNMISEFEEGLKVLKGLE
jgi:enoyl-[acyl-carrier protein] reductase II